MSELKARESEIREAARSCRSYGDLAAKLKWPIESVRRADELFNLGLAPKLFSSVHTPGVAVPKPAKKGAKGGEA